MPWLIGRGGTLGSAGVGVVGFCPKIPISVGFHWDFGILCRFWWVSPQNRMAYRVGWDFGVCGCWGRWVLPPKSPFLLGFGILCGFRWVLSQDGHLWLGLGGILWVLVGFTPKSHVLWGRVGLWGLWVLGSLGSAPKIPISVEFCWDFGV